MKPALSPAKPELCVLIVRSDDPDCLPFAISCIGLFCCAIGSPALSSATVFVDCAVHTLLDPSPRGTRKPRKKSGVVSGINKISLTTL